MPLPNLSLQERNQLVLDLIAHCNFFPKIWEGRHPWVLGCIIHKITDPRETEPMPFSRGTRFIAAIKRNQALWIRLKPFTVPHSWNKICKCKHSVHNHTGVEQACTAHESLYDLTTPFCKCLHYEERGL